MEDEAVNHSVGATVKYGFRQRGYGDEMQGKEIATALGWKLAKRAGKEALDTYMSGVRAARREKRIASAVE